MRKFIAICLLTLLIIAPVFSTGMPVIDISAITTAVQGISTSISQWSQQIQQWKSEYERIQKSIEKLKSGDFLEVISSVGDLATQLGSWKLASSDYQAFGNTLFSTNAGFVDDAFSSIGDGSYDLVKTLRYFTGKGSDGTYSFADGILAKNWKMLSSKLKEAQAQFDTASDSGNVWGSGGSISSSADVASSFLDVGAGTLSTFASIIGSAGDAINGFLSIGITPDEVAEMLENVKKDALKGFGGSESKLNEEVEKAKAAVEQSVKIYEEVPASDLQAKADAEVARDKAIKTLNELAELKSFISGSAPYADAYGVIGTVNNGDDNLNSKIALLKNEQTAYSANVNMKAAAERQEALSQALEEYEQKQRFFANATVSLAGFNGTAEEFWAQYGKMWKGYAKTSGPADQFDPASFEWDSERSTTSTSTSGR